MELTGVKNKVCVITGGGGIIGTALGLGLAEAGAKVVIVDFNEAKAVEVAELINKQYLREIEMKSDVEIAQEAIMKPIVQVAEDLEISEEELEFYGKYKAKVSLKTSIRLGHSVLTSSIGFKITFSPRAIK